MPRLIVEFVLLFLLFYLVREFARKLFAANAHRRQADGGEDPHAHPHARQGGAGASDILTEQDAYEILGLQEGATLEEIGEAHRSLMKRLHPDKGGSSWLAVRLNAAKEILVKTHN